MTACSPLALAYLVMLWPQYQVFYPFLFFSAHFVATEFQAGTHPSSALFGANQMSFCHLSATCQHQFPRPCCALSSHMLLNQFPRQCCALSSRMLLIKQSVSATPRSQTSQAQSSRSPSCHNQTPQCDALALS